MYWNILVYNINKISRNDKIIIVIILRHYYDSPGEYLVL